MSSVVEVKNLTKVFGDVTAVNNVSFTIEEKDFLILLGPSGCGKTTILRMIAGLEEPTSGEIYLNGKLVYSSEKKVFIPARERGVGLVFQSYALWPHMTVFENIAFGLRVKHYDSETIRRKVHEGLSYMQLEEMANRYPQEMSGGQQQRVALARMLVSEPGVFLMDEPLSNLDAKLRLEMRAEIKNIHLQTGATTVYVTHDQVEALTMANKIAVMNKGRIEQFDKPKTIYKHPSTLFVADFIGSPTINKVNGTVSVENGVVTIRNGSFVFHTAYTSETNLANGDEVVAAIRPENILVTKSDGSFEDTSGNGIEIKTNIFDAEIYTVLPAGPETILQVKFGNYIFNLLITQEVEYSPGERVRIYLSPKDILLFSSKTGKLIQ